MRMPLRAVALATAACLLAACQVSLEREADQGAPTASATGQAGAGRAARLQDLQARTRDLLGQSRSRQAVPSLPPGSASPAPGAAAPDAMPATPPATQGVEITAGGSIEDELGLHEEEPLGGQARRDWLQEAADLQVQGTGGELALGDSHKTTIISGDLSRLTVQGQFQEIVVDDLGAAEIVGNYNTIWTRSLQEASILGDFNRVYWLGGAEPAVTINGRFNETGVN
ncbi:hypothetical protein [Buchananella hordeovulneris]|uniref:hypothetical protein n=1 Tax=Buchananella hordeovulneris TaxID=52770 RepID=UPI0026DC12C0|nr:hypothetical protein [Buchananella hordeovulneris]MDO5080506.1 hypothetical protein [Buchananella hordeovulneris]